MLNNIAANVQDNFDRESLVEEVIKYRIKKYGDCGLKLIFTTIAGDFYKDEAIKKFDGSLLNTCEGLIKIHSGERIAVDGIYNLENDTYKAKPYLIFKRSIAAASLEYIETLDFKNKNLDSDVKMCIVNIIINSKDSRKLLDPKVFSYLINILEEINPLDYKVDLKNTLTLLEYIANNIKYYVKEKVSYISKVESSSSKIEPKKALELLKGITSKFERLNNNDLIMAVYRITKCVKDFDKDEVNLAYEII